MQPNLHFDPRYNFDPISLFPGLNSDNRYLKESNPTATYNCIAWSLEINNQYWWPDILGTWPTNLPFEETIENFVKMYEQNGYVECPDDIYEKDFDKVALYALDGVPTHAARQKSDGIWTSKLGKGPDIQHTLNAIEGRLPGNYGFVVKFFRKPKTT